MDIDIRLKQLSELTLAELKLLMVSHVEDWEQTGDGKHARLAARVDYEIHNRQLTDDATDDPTLEWEG